MSVGRKTEVLDRIFNETKKTPTSENALRNYFKKIRRYPPNKSLVIFPSLDYVYCISVHAGRYKSRDDLFVLFNLA